jgi:hypothetical protein
MVDRIATVLPLVGTARTAAARLLQDGDRESGFPRMTWINETEDSESLYRPTSVHIASQLKRAEKPKELSIFARRAAGVTRSKMQVVRAR